MAKKQSIVSEINSALEAVAARAEKLVASTKAKKTTSTTSAAAAKPVAKRTTAAKHSKTASTVVESKPEPKAAPAVATAPAVAPVVITPVVISHDEIAKLAYSYWEARGYQPGNPAEDWARAEAELKQRA